MPRDHPRLVQVMTTEVLTFAPDDNVQRRHAARWSTAASTARPWSTPTARWSACSSTGDLIVQESQLHFPTVISLLGATLELPQLEAAASTTTSSKALGATRRRGHAPRRRAPSGPTTRSSGAATLMHDHDVSPPAGRRRDGRLVGIVARGDILRAIVGDDAADARPDAIAVTSMRPAWAEVDLDADRPQRRRRSRAIAAPGRCCAPW